MRNFLLSTLCHLSFLALTAEIVEVRVDWNNVQCQPDCAKLLERNFQSMKEVSQVNVSASDGVAKLAWKANTPFKYQPLRAAFARVGIEMDNLHLTVRGTIYHKNKDFYIRSLGDKTEFKLLGTIEPGQNRYQPTNSTFNRPLSDQIRAKLSDAEKSNSVVSVSGPILNPNQFPPLDLITERVSVSE